MFHEIMSLSMQNLEMGPNWLLREVRITPFVCMVGCQGLCLVVDADWH